MTDVPVLKMKDDVPEEESKENNFTKLFATPSTVKPKSVRRSLGVFTTPTAYYQGLLTDFGSVYRSKARSVFSTSRKPSDYSLSENSCGKIAEDADRVDCSIITASGIVSESKATNKAYDGKTLNSASNNLFSVTEEPDLLNADHQESHHDLVEQQGECFGNVDVVSVDERNQDVVDQQEVVGVSENSAQGSFRITPTKEVIIDTDSQQAEEYQKINFDNGELVTETTDNAHKPEFPQIKSDSNDMLKEMSDTAQDVDKKHENQEELTLESMEGKKHANQEELTLESMEDKKHENQEELTLESMEDKKHENQEELTLESMEDKKHENQEELTLESMEDKKHENQEELTLESMEREITAEVVKVGETVMGVGQGSLDVKDEDSQNTEDSGLFSLSSSIDVNDKIELGNDKYDVPVNDILTCSLPEDVHTMNTISTEEHLLEGESVKNEIISKDVSVTTTECSHFQNNHIISEKFTCIVEENVDHGSSEVVTIPLHEEKIDNSIHRDSSPDDNVVELCENTTVVDLEVPHQNSLKCTGGIENERESQDNLLSKAFQPDSYNTTNIDQGISTLIEDVELDLFNERVGKRKTKDTNKKGRRKSIRLQMRDVNSHYCIQENLAQINEADVADAVTNTDVDCISGDIDSLSKVAVGIIECKDKQQMQTNHKLEKGLSDELATDSSNKELVAPIQNIIKQNRSKRNSRRPRKKKTKKKTVISPDTNHVVNVPTEVNSSQSTTPDAAMIQQCTTDINATTKSMQSSTCKIVQPRNTVGSDMVSDLQERATLTSSDSGSNRQETCLYSSTCSPKEIPDTASYLQETCMSSSTYSPKEIQTVESLLQDANTILKEFDGLDDLDIFKEVTETNAKEKTKNRRTQKRAIGREKNTRRRSARLAGFPVLDNIFNGEPNNACTSSAPLEASNEISEKTEERSISQRKIRKLKRTSFGKPLMLLNMFGTIDVDETCDSELIERAEIDQTDSATGLPQHVTEDICEESSTVFNVDVPKYLLDVCDEQNSFVSAFVTHEPSGADVLVDSEPNSACVASVDDPLITSKHDLASTPQEQPAKRSCRRKQIIQPISKPKTKKEPLKKEMSPEEIEQLYINRGSCSKVIKPNLLETIFETSCQPNAVPVINIGKKKFNRMMTFQSPWLPRKRSNKKKGKRLIVKTRKFKISNQIIVDKLDDVLCDLDAFETLLYQ